MPNSLAVTAAEATLTSRTWSIKNKCHKVYHESVACPFSFFLPWEEKTGELVKRVDGSNVPNPTLLKLFSKAKQP